MRTRDPLGLEPADGDFVKYVEAMQASQADALRAANLGAASGIEAPAAADKSDGVGLSDLIAALKRTVARERARDAAEAQAAAKAAQSNAAALPAGEVAPRRRSVLDEFRGKPARPAQTSTRRRRNQPLQFIAAVCTMFGAFAAFVGVQEGLPEFVANGLAVCVFGLILAAMLAFRRQKSR